MANEASSDAEKPKKNGERQAGNLRGEGGYLPDVHRLLPQSADAEKCLLGSILLMPVEVIGECVEAGIQPEHFHIPAHAVIYMVLLDLWNKDHAVDIITLTQALRDRNKLEEAGGAAQVSSLPTFVPTAVNASYYMHILQEKYTLRSIISTCTDYARRSYDEQEDVPMLLDEVEQKIFNIAQERYKNKQVPFKKQVFDAFEAIEELYQRRGKVSGLETGYSQLDKMTNGLHPGEMIVIAARPSMGKTAIAMNIAEHVAIQLQKPVAIFSLEMSTQQLIQRMLCSRARVNLRNMDNTMLKDVDFRNLTSAASELSAGQVFIDDSGDLTIMELRAKARRLKAQHKIELIVIDYLQLLRSNTRRAAENRQIEISEISHGIKALSKDVQVPIIVLAQLNRNPENRTGESKGRPRLSDLRESGSIEQDADFVGLLFREKQYAETDEERNEAEGKAELIIAKQRNGPTGSVPLTFLEEYMRFVDRAFVPEQDQE